MDLGFAVFAGTLLAASLPLYISFDAVVKRQHLIAPSEWERDGRPAGFVWRVGTSTLRERRRRGELLTDWLFTTPQWARDDHESLKLLRHLRFAAAFWTVSVAAAAFFAATH